MTHIQVAPDVEFKLDIDLSGINENSRDYDIQPLLYDIDTIDDTRTIPLVWTHNGR